MPNIDPLKESKASKEYIQMGATSLNMVSRNLNGSDGETNRAKLKKEIPELTPVPWEKSSESAVESDSGGGGTTKRGPGRPRGS